MHASRGEEGHTARMDEIMATTELTMGGLRESKRERICWIKFIFKVTIIRTS